MDTNNNMAIKGQISVKPSNELDNAEEAFAEFRQTGASEKHCLRCGGKLQFYDGGSGYMVWCENGDYKLTARGI
jgi:hypothetical protein